MPSVDLPSGHINLRQFHRLSPRAAAIAKLALELSERYDRPPVFPIETAHQLGLEVLFGQFTGELVTKSSFIDTDRKEIYCNEQLTAYEQTLAIGVQIGHYELHRSSILRDNSIYEPFSILDSSSGGSEILLEALYFASYFLVPKRLLRLYAPLASHRDLEELFIVPSNILDFRIELEQVSFAA